MLDNACALLLLLLPCFFNMYKHVEKEVVTTTIVP
jgi:hypothetical protein